MTTIHVIDTNEKDEALALLLPLGADSAFNRDVWVFLVENLQPGFDLFYYTDDEKVFSWPSGQKIPPDVYAQLVVLYAFPPLEGDEAPSGL